MSHLVIFDMEWNMGYYPKTFMYNGVEQVLRGEIIQIGAVKIENSQMTDTFNVILRPRIFKKLHHQVAKVTGLSQKQLDQGLPAAKGLELFKQWCGEDAVLGEWGHEDVPVLKQNLFIYGQDENWPLHWVDLQRIYTAQHPLNEGEGLALKSVIERLGIRNNEDFHDALADAVYTARIMQTTDLDYGLKTYPSDEMQIREILCPKDKVRFDFTSWKGFTDGSAWNENQQIRTACCPECGKVLKPDIDDMWLSRGNNCMYSMGTCTKHGASLIWLRRSCSDGLHYMFARATEKADDKMADKWKRDKKAVMDRALRKQQQSNENKSQQSRKTGKVMLQIPQDKNKI